MATSRALSRAFINRTYHTPKSTFTRTSKGSLSLALWTPRSSRFISSSAEAEAQVPSGLSEELLKKSKALAIELRKLNHEMTQFYQTTLGHSKGPFTIQETAPSLTTYPFKVEENMIKVRSGSDVVIPNIWLRDNCQCSSCMHKATKQRLLDTFQIPRDITIRSSEIDPEGVRVKWSDGHESHYTADFLSSSHMSYLQRAKVRQDLVNIKLWDESIAQRPPIVSYDNFHDKDGVKDVLDKIRTFGFCYIDQLPVSPEATEKALERIAFIRPTHYGGFYDFTADLASKDTAYTNIYLEAHTDTTYFSDPAGLQAFHLLEHSGGEGGTSLLVDGFKVAKDLNHLDREAYHILSTVNVHSHASGNEGISIQPYRGFPVFQHDPETGILLQIRWNSSDRAGVALPVDQVEEWYDAARKWNDLLKKNENEYWCQLTPGRLVVFDNWRVLHGRSAFTGKRRICGGYINRDDWISKHKMLHFGQDAVMKHLPTG